MKIFSVKRYKKWLAVFLTAIMLFSMLPTFMFSVSADTGNFTKISDPSTVNGWKGFFGPTAKDTTWVGGVWSDKSVFKSAEDYKAATAEDDDGLNLEIGKNNFLVSLSTIASSKSVEGYTTLPTDSILVLDLSGSMDVSGGTDPYVTMVNSANNAIESLLALNPNNRVGVIAYSGNTSTGSAATPQTATVILPLGRYEKGIDSQNRRVYLTSSWTERSGRNTVTRNGVKVASGVTGTVAPGVTSTFSDSNSKQVTGGTYTQNGIYKAWQMFEQVSDTAISGGVQAGTVRMPVVVLMTDGSPTVATTDYTNVGNSNSGNGQENVYGSVGISFLTQLTASYSIDKIGEKYGRSPLVYTLGLNVGSKQAALSLLDPANNTSANSYWNSFKQLANSSDKTMQVAINVAGTERKTITYKEPVNAQKGWNQYYVTKYFGANDTASLTNAFNDIVEQITIQSFYYPTLVDGGDTINHGGFIEFDDYIGDNMEVKAIKGIQLGSKLYDGSTLARMIYSGGMGTVENPTDVGNNLVWAVKDRMAISDTNVARELIGKAYANGQLYYNAVTGEYSNYIGWYANGKGEYVGFWDGKDDSPSAVPAEIADSAVFAIKSYGFYDAVGEGHRKTDMMYATIQVRTTLKDTASDKYDASKVGNIRVIGKLPASLVPLVEYNIELNGLDPEDPASMTISGASAPSRLLYEVGLDSDIDVLNIENTAKKPLVKNSDGDYVFYTNQWSSIDGYTYSYTTNKNTISFFEPSKENERYYYNTDSDIFTNKQGTAYVSANAPVYSASSPLYHRTLIYKEVSGNIVAEWYYEEVSQNVLSNSDALVKRSDNTWYVKAGTIHHYFGDYQVEKTDNNTGTINFSDKPFVHAPVDGKKEQVGYHVDSYLGNNGMLIFDAYEGVKITKIADATITDRNAEYEFTVSAPVSANLTLIKENASGERAESTIDFATSYTLKLKHGESAYILGSSLIGKDVTVKENVPADAGYAVYSVNGDTSVDSAVMTVSESVINSAEFVNTVPKTGDVVITKQVVSDIEGHFDDDFTFTVNFSDGKEYDAVYSDGAKLTLKSGDTVTLKHNESIDINDVADGTVVSVSETVPAGFTANAVSQNATAKSGETKYIDFVNTYFASPTDKANIEITVNKNLINSALLADGKVIDFEFALQKWNGTDYEKVENSAVINYSKNGANTVNIDLLKDEVYASAGVYYYRIIEVVNEENVKNGIVYDTTYGRFSVTVVDDGNGKLKIASVDNIANTVINGNSVTATFNNTYQISGAAEAVIGIKKTVKNIYNQTATILPAGFKFELFEADSNYNIVNAAAIASSPETAAAGTTRLSVVYSDGISKDYHYVLKESGGTMNGVTYTTKEYKVLVSVKVEDGYYIIDMEIFDGANKVAEASSTASADKLIAVAEVGGIEFENTFTPEKVTVAENLRGIKNLFGRNITSTDNFTFALYETNANYSTAGVTPDTKVADYNNNGIFNFGEFSFDREGTYYYVIRENVPSDAVDGVYNGVTYDKNEYRIKVVVTGDSVNGKLVANASMTVFDGVTEAPATAIVFNNVYRAEGTSAVISGTKTLEGGIIKLQANAFHFELIENGRVIATIGNGVPVSDTKAGFEFNLNYDTAGIYEYKIREKVPQGVDSSNKLNGVVYDKNEYTVTVTVTDNGKGKLEASVNYGSTSPDFVNKYEVTPTSFDIAVKKTLKGDSIAEHTFDFELYSAVLVDGEYVRGNLIATRSNGTDGMVYFDSQINELNFSTIGAYRFIIVEKAGNKALMEYDKTIFKVEIDITDNLSGVLVANAKYIKVTDNGEQEVSTPIFENVYNEESVTAEIKGDKSFNKELTGGEFTFELYQALKGADGKINAVGEAVLTAKNDADGKFKFAEQNGSKYITYDTAGVYYYVIKEQIPDTAENGVFEGITYSDKEYVVTVTVTEGLNGTRSILKTEVSYSDTVEFVNTYSAKGSAKIEGKKLLDGKNLENEEFTFALYDSEGKELATAKNDADGNFSFSVDYTKTGVYNYTVKEIKGNGKGITYDETVYDVTVTVTDDNKGKLTCDTQIKKGQDTAEAIEFANVYTEPAPQTGDNMNLTMWLIIAAVSLVLILIIAVLKRKSCKE